MSLKTPPSSPSKQSPSEEIIIKIVSASYGPCEGQQLLTGALSNDPSAKIPYTRDVTPILRALLKMQESHASSNSSSTTRSGLDKEDPHLVRLRAISGEMGGMKRTSITIQALQDGWNSMNIVFGDVCPGISKKLYIHYVIFHKQQLSPGKNSSCKQASLVASEVHHVNFAENEPVLLRRRVTFYQEDSKLQQATARVVLKKGLPKDATSNVMDANFGDLEDGGDEDERTLRVARRMGRSDSIIEFAQLSVNNNATQNAAPSPQQPATPPKPKRLRSATFEIVLPIALSFLHVPDRVQCRLVCRLWQNILSDIGVASVIDSSDPTFQHAFTRPFLRGILAHSHSSLHSLRLCDFHELCPEDLQASLPHLRKLRVLDISRCIKLQDETLQAVAKYAGATLEVLYIKGLVNVSDAGLIAICESCSKLKVLEVSHIPITDEGGVAMGRLKNLRALYMRDNYKLTNKSVDTITANCKKLIQLTLWGSTKVKHLSFGGMATAAGSASNGMLSPLQSHLPTNQNTLSSGGKLLSLSLWGCFKLGDDIAVALGNLKNLRTLIVSECHKLTDQFVVSMCATVAIPYSAVSCSRPPPFLLAEDCGQSIPIGSLALALLQTCHRCWCQCHCQRHGLVHLRSELLFQGHFSIDLFSY